MLAELLKSPYEPGLRALNSYVNKRSFLALTHFSMHTGNYTTLKKAQTALHVNEVECKESQSSEIVQHYLIVPQSTIFLLEYSCAVSAHNHGNETSITQCRFQPFHSNTAPH